MALVPSAHLPDLLDGCLEGLVLPLQGAVPFPEPVHRVVNGVAGVSLELRRAKEVAVLAAATQGTEVPVMDIGVP